MSEPGARPALHLGAALLAACLALAPLLLGTGPLAGPRDLPLSLASDEVGQYVWVRTLAESGQVLVNDRLGLPDGQVLADFPQVALSPVQVTLVRLLLLAAPWQEAVNLYLVLGFALVALAAYPALALAGLRPRWAVVGAVLYATTPYHFARGAAHLFHSLYLGMPWLALACCWLLRGAPGGPTGRRGAAACLGMGVLLGGIEPYYSAFALGLLPCCAALGAARHGRRPLGRGLALTAMIMAVVALAWWPVRGEVARRGPNPTALARTHWESEFYALKLTSLLVPADDHRSEWMRGWARRYRAAPLTNENRLNASGVLGGLGILGLLAALLAGGHGAPRRRVRGRLLVLVLLVSTMGGLGSAVALLGIRVVRAWNRLAILATWLGLAEVMGWLQDRSDSLGPVAARGLATAVLAFGLWDQVPREPLRRAPDVEGTWRAGARAWRDLERERPDLRRLLVVPHRNHLQRHSGGYAQWWDQQTPFLHTQEMGFSAGSYAGRRGERRVAALASLPLAPLLYRASREGWDALVVDTEAHPGPAPAWLQALETRIPGVGLGKYRVHPLTGCAAACAPQARGMYLRAGLGVESGHGGFHEPNLMEAVGELLVLHGGDDTRRARLDLRARGVAGEDGALRVSAPGIEPVVLELAPGAEARSDLHVAVPPEGLTLRLETDLPRALEAVRLPELGRRLDLSGTQVTALEDGPPIREFR